MKQKYIQWAFIVLVPFILVYCLPRAVLVLALAGAGYYLLCKLKLLNGAEEDTEDA